MLPGTGQETQKVSDDLKTKIFVTKATLEQNDNKTKAIITETVTQTAVSKRDSGTLSEELGELRL